jgi:hypothetical protein
MSFLSFESIMGYVSEYSGKITFNLAYSGYTYSKRKIMLKLVKSFVLIIVGRNFEPSFFHDHSS